MLSIFVNAIDESFRSVHVTGLDFIIKDCPSMYKSLMYRCSYNYNNYVGKLYILHLTYLINMSEICIILHEVYFWFKLKHRLNDYEILPLMQNWSKDVFVCCIIYVSYFFASVRDSALNPPPPPPLNIPSKFHIHTFIPFLVFRCFLIRRVSNESFGSDIV